MKKREERLNESLARRRAEKESINEAEALILDDDLLVLVAALKRALGSGFYRDPFSHQQCLTFGSANHDYWMRRLLQQGVLLCTDPIALDGADEPDSECHRADGGAASLVFAAIENEDMAVLERLKEHRFTNGEKLKALWLDYATGECMALLLRLMETPQKLAMTPEDQAQTADTIKEALRRYSIANLCSAIWKVVQDVTTLFHKQYFNPRSAAAIIPNALRVLLEQVAAKKRAFMSWDRPYTLPLSTLGQAFFELWGFDDSTRGREVLRLFSGMGADKGRAPAVYGPEAISLLLQQVLDLNIASEALATFAVSILAGDSMEQALREVAVAHRLDQPESP